MFATANTYARSAGTWTNTFFTEMNKLTSLILSIFVFLAPLFTHAGDLETRYSQRGGYEIAETVVNIDDGKGSSWYKLYYPDGYSGVEFPAIVFANGTGATANWYNGFLRTLASYGYIVIGNDVRMVRTGESVLAMAEYLLKIDADPDSPFCGMIDESKLGVCGHSQGGDAAADCAVFDKDHGFDFASLCTIELSVNTAINAPLIIDFADIDCPVFMTAGTGIFDAKTITPPEFMTENWNNLSGGYPAVCARSVCTDHADICLLKNGGYQVPYVIAWFEYTLKGDSDAAKVFAGDSPEIQNTDRWQDVLIK